LRGIYLDQVDRGQRTNWETYAAFAFTAEQLDLRGPEDRLHLGHELGPDFKIVGPVRRGGFSTVYRAIDLFTGKPVAIKAPRLGPHAEEYSQQLRAEAEALSRMALPGTPRFIGMADTADGPCLFMEWVSGETLQSLLRKGTMSRPEVLRTFARVARVIDSMHERGYVHGDVRLENVIVRDNGDVTLLDFGTTRHNMPTARRRPDRGGTLAFMSPESIISSPVAGQIADDVFSLGAVLYQVLSGRPLRAKGDLPSVLDGITKVESQVRSTSALNAAEKSLCLASLQTVPWERFERAADFADACEHVADGRYAGVELRKIRPRVVALRIGRLLGGIEAKAGMLKFALDRGYGDWVSTTLPGVSVIADEMRAVRWLSNCLSIDVTEWESADRFAALAHRASELGEVDACGLSQICERIADWCRQTYATVIENMKSRDDVVMMCDSRALRMALFAPGAIKVWLDDPSGAPLPPQRLWILERVMASSPDESVWALTIRKVESLFERGALFDWSVDGFGCFISGTGEMGDR
jgi:serine/threonine protein kinase